MIIVTIMWHYTALGVHIGRRTPLLQPLFPLRIKWKHILGCGNEQLVPVLPFLHFPCIYNLQGN